ncbi:MAG: hypothetical protein JWM68_2562, partial [Verrucomicrobiales bacterium]|nr:hypothetical protein [Verrucomicrobiales bacterium]
MKKLKRLVCRAAVNYSILISVGLFSVVGGIGEATPNQTKPFSVVFIDGGIEGSSILLRSVTPGNEVFLLDPTQEEPSQIAARLKSFNRSGRRLQSIHIISHGSEGSLLLGAARINASNLEQQVAMLDACRQALGQDGEIFLYGCNVGKGEAGQVFLDTFAKQTGASVAASDNFTGDSRLGGDWTLEVGSGQVRSQTVFNFPGNEDYPYLLVDKLYYITAITGTPAAGDGLRVINTDGTGGTTILDNNTIKNANALALDVANNRAFVWDQFAGSEALYAINLTSGALTTVSGITGTGLTVQAMEVDSANSLLYFISAASGNPATGDSLWKIPLAGGTATKVMDNNLIKNANALALDIANNRAFVWDQFAGSEAIYTINLTSGAVATVSGITGTGLTVAAMKVDTVNSLLYFISGASGSPATGDSLWKIPLAGGTAVKVMDNNLIKNPNALALDLPNGRAFVWDQFLASEILYTVNLSSGAVASFLSLAGSGLTVGAMEEVVSAASVTGVNATTANGSYKAGQTIAITVTFSSAVTVTGTPRLQLNSGGSVFANYSSGSGGATLTFNYVIGAGETSADLDYSSTGALTLNGGTIANSGTSSALTLASPGASGSLGANKNIIIDTTSPTISISSPSANVTGAGAVTYTVTYADANFNSSTLVTNNITLNATGTANGAMAVSGSGTNRTVTISSITGNGTLGILIASGTASDT